LLALELLALGLALPGSLAALKDLLLPGPRVTAVYIFPESQLVSESAPNGAVVSNASTKETHMSSERPNPAPAQALGRVIADARQQSGLTTDALAASAGLESSVYEAIERGEHEPSLKMIVAIAAALQLTATELFDRARL
jgi:DNA-binding XRE family transcriptional regulator